MSALITLLLSHAKLVLVTVAVASTATVATVAVNDVPAATEWAELSADDLIHAAETPEPLAAEEADELLAEFAAACGADAVAPDLTGLSEDEAEAAVEPLIEACEDAAESESDAADIDDADIDDEDTEDAAESESDAAEADEED